MDRRDALRVLGLTDEAPADEIRARYLDLVRKNHPDVARDGGAADVAAITEAYRVVITSPPEPARPAPRRHIAVTSDGDSLSVAMPGYETFRAVAEAATKIGSIAYIDADAALLEAVITLTSGVTCSLVMTLQGRATGVTDVFCTVEPLGNGEAPPVAVLVAELAGVLHDLLNS